MARTIGIIQAQMGSRRLPGKILAPLADQPLLERLHSRVAASRVDQWWLATSSDPGDDVTEAWGFELGLRVYRGDRSDVLSRFAAIGSETAADWIVRVRADHPFVDSPLIDSLIDARDDTQEAKAADLLQHRSGLALHDERADPQGEPSRSPGLPVGYEAQLIRKDALVRVARKIPAGSTPHRAHVASWLVAHGRVFDVPTPERWPHRPHWRWSIDTYEDLAMARSAFRLFGADSSRPDYPTMVDRLDAHPEITAMNTHIEDEEPEVASAATEWMTQ